MFKMLVSHTWTIQLYPQKGSDKTGWNVSICGDSNSIAVQKKNKELGLIFLDN
jgi:hypothetical protein